MKLLHYRAIDDSESENLPEHHCHIWVGPVCAGDRVVLRVVGTDVDGGLMAEKMVKYTAKG